MRCIRTLVAITAILTTTRLVHAQTFHQKFSYGGRVGPNLWLNDLNDRRVGLGVEGFVRWGVTQSAALGLAFGFEALKSAQVARTAAVPYLALNGYHGAATSWIFLSSSKKFVPYLSAGVGGMMYARRAAEGQIYPGERAGFSLVIPIGAGFEAFVKKDLSISFDLGYRILNNSTDDLPTGSDSYPTVKIGVTFLTGSNDDDDDDGDGLTNGQERKLGLDPENSDTDKDFSNDGDEVRIYRTEPRKPDTDGDSLLDGDEVWRFRTDPLKADTDGDGVSDGNEIYTHNTDPLLSDSDKDGLTEGDEVLVYKTDPLKTDTDGDGLNDPDEIFSFKTDPLKADSDGGGEVDGAEIRRAANPLAPADDIKKAIVVTPDVATPRDSVARPIVIAPKDSNHVEIGKPYVIKGLTFEPWSADINSKNEESLEPLLQLLALNPTFEVEIRGHTDNGGSHSRNVALSRNRARSVKAWLIKRGIEGRRISVKGFGPDQPIAPNDTDDNKSKNRRIEFVRTK